MIAVMGAAGNVGGKAAKILLDRGQRVRVLQHRRPLDELAERGAEVVSGNAADPGDLETLFRGAEAALVLLPEDVRAPGFGETRSRISRALAKALTDSKVGHVVALSAMLGSQAAIGPMVGLRELEQLLGGLEANVLVLRSAAYMDYLLASVPLIRSQRINGSVVRADLLFPYVATGDVAGVAADALIDREFAGHEVRRLLGPEDLTMVEITRQLGNALGMPDLPYLQFPPDELAGALRQQGMSEEVAGLLVNMQLSMNEGLFSEDIRRGADTQTPTRFADFLATAFPEVANSTVEVVTP